MGRGNECTLLLNELSRILDEEHLDKRVDIEFEDKQICELASCINKVLDISEAAVARTIDTENTYLNMKGELQSNIRNPLSSIKGGVFLINLILGKCSNDSEKLVKYIRIIEKAVEDIEIALK